MDEQVVKLRNLDEIITVLESLINDPEYQAPEEFKFEGDLANIKLYFKGENYHSSMPASCIKGLWEYQQSLYRGVAELLYGSSRITVLTKEDLKNFELVFKISEGSVDIAAALVGFLNSLSKGFSTMESKHKAITMALIAALITGGFTTVYLNDSNQETQQSQINLELEVVKEEQKTRQFELMAGLVGGNEKVKEFNNHVVEGHRAIIKGASDAEEIHIGPVKFDRHEILEISQRSSRTQAEVKVYNEPVKIIKIEPQEGVTRITFSRENDEELTSLMDDEQFEGNDLESIWKAARSRAHIKLQFSVTRAGENVRGTQIVGLGIDKIEDES